MIVKHNKIRWSKINLMNQTKREASDLIFHFIYISLNNRDLTLT